jgi:hypothetical protein
MTARRTWPILGSVALAVTVALASTPHPAHAQDGGDEVVGEVDIAFDIGEPDPTTGDFLIDAVLVSGDLEDGQDFTVVLLDADGVEVWSATQEFTNPVTEIDVTEPVGVGAVASAGVEQGLTIVEGVQIEPPVVEWSAGGGGAGGGELALSMVLAVLLVAMVFRTPLPSASVQRWTK